VNRENISPIIVSILVFLADNDELLGQLVSSTGADHEDLVQNIESPDVQIALLDFLLDEEARVMSFCSIHQIEPATLWRLRQTLPGGNVPHWI
jgi:hypothetical protein